MGKKHGHRPTDMSRDIYSEKRVVPISTVNIFHTQFSQTNRVLQGQYTCCKKTP